MPRQRMNGSTNDIQNAIRMTHDELTKAKKVLGEIQKKLPNRSTNIHRAYMKALKKYQNGKQTPQQTLHNF